MSSLQKKVLLIGNTGVGKTTFLKKLRTGEFDLKFISTYGVEVHPVDTGKIKFYVWDCAGQERLAVNKTSFYEGTDACIIMFDTQSTESLISIEKHANLIIKSLGLIPIILVCNKNDLIPSYKEIHKEAIYISSKNDTFRELMLPFLKLEKMLLNE